MINLDEKLDQISAKLSFFEAATRSFLESIESLKTDQITAISRATDSLSRGMLSLEGKCYDAHQRTIRWFLDLNLNISLDSLASTIFTPDLEKQINDQIESSLKLKVISSKYSIKSFSDPDCKRRAPTNSVVLKVEIAVQGNLWVTLYVPLYILGEGPGFLRALTASTPRIETNARLGRPVIETARTRFRKAVDDALLNPIPVSIQNPVDSAPLTLADVLVSADQISFFPAPASKKYPKGILPYIPIRFGYSYSLELFPRYFFPILDRMLSNFDKRSIVMPAGFDIDYINIIKLEEYMMVLDFRIKVRITGRILSSNCAHEFTCDYIFLVDSRVGADRQFQLFLQQRLSENVTLKSYTRGDIPNPICLVEHDGIGNYLRSLPEIVLIQEQLSVSRAEFKVYPPYGAGQNVELRFFS